MTPYRQYYRQQQQEAKHRLVLRQRSGIAQAQNMATLLRDKYDVTAVWLFGSLTEPQLFHVRSDIDLAVEGLALSHYCAALGKILCSLKGFSADLIRVESAPNSLLKVIQQEGVLLLSCPRGSNREPNSAGWRMTR